MLAFTAGLIFWLLGVIVYLMKPKTPTSWAFFQFCLSIGTYSLTGFQIQSDPEPPWYDITALSMSFMPAAAFT